MLLGQSHERTAVNRFLAIVGAAVVAGCAAPNNPSPPATDMQALASQLRSGGYVIVVRHGATNRDQADTDPLNLDNVAKQRQLSDAGREQARQVGEAWRKLGIPVGTVYSSRFNRAKETGRLVGGIDVTPTDDVSEGGQVVTPIENDRRADAMRRLANTPPPAGRNTL